MNFSSEDYQLLDFALREDVGAGDVTSEFFVGENDQASARAIAKERAVVAGTEVAAEIFRRVDPDLRLEIAQKDGAVVSAGTTVLEIRGRARSILTAERVALNFLQRLSGIATLTHQFVEAAGPTGAKILDTRKTTPGLRKFEKAAVLAGGGTNHRFGLFDMVLVKDNHLLARNGHIGVRIGPHGGVLIGPTAQFPQPVRDDLRYGFRSTDEHPEHGERRTHAVPQECDPALFHQFA